MCLCVRAHARTHSVGACVRVSVCELEGGWGGSAFWRVARIESVRNMPSSRDQYSTHGGVRSGQVNLLTSGGAEPAFC